MNEHITIKQRNTLQPQETLPRRSHQARGGSGGISVGIHLTHGKIHTLDNRQEKLGWRNERTESRLTVTSAFVCRRIYEDCVSKQNNLTDFSFHLFVQEYPYAHEYRQRCKDLKRWVFIGFCLVFSIGL